MEDMLTVSEVSRAYGVSARMLRYYEKIGLLGSERREGYAYRVYRPEDIQRLRQIVVLRKLRLPLKEIGEILNDPGTAAAISVFERNLSRLDGELQALQAARGVIAEFCAALRQRRALPAGDVILQNTRLMALADALAPSSTLIQKERKTMMENLKQADRSGISMTDVRIVRLPESDVAAAHAVGDDPEYRAGVMIADFARSARLWEKHPGLRLYGFNHPSPVDDTGWHGYEFWLTIPEGLEVPPPLQKKHFPGGTYAAHMIQMGSFEEWGPFYECVTQSDAYEYAGSGDPEDMFGNLEEHLNYHGHLLETPDGDPETSQLDLLIPVRRKKQD